MGNPYQTLNLPGLDALEWWDRATTDTFSVHHTVTQPPANNIGAELASIMAVHAYHRDPNPAINKGPWGGHGYHAACFNSGRWWRVNANDKIPRAGVAHHNHHVLHIACYDTLTNKLPEDGMIEAVNSAIDFYRDEFGDCQILAHRQMITPGYETSCPGDVWQQWVPFLGEEKDMTPEDKEWFNLMKQAMDFIIDDSGNTLTGIDALRFFVTTQGSKLLEGQRQLFAEKHNHIGQAPGGVTEAQLEATKEIIMRRIDNLKVTG